MELYGVSEEALRQAAEAIFANVIAKCPLPRAEEAAEGLSDPVCTDDFGPDDHSKGDLDQPEKETLPTHDQQFHQGAQCYNQRDFNRYQSRKIDVPNLKQASAGEAGVVSTGDCGGPDGSFKECVQLTFSNDKVTIAMDSAEICRILNQTPTRTFAIKVSSPSVDSAQSLTCELRWEPGL